MRNIQGYITDRATNEPLPMANVFVSDEKGNFLGANGASSNIDGYYTLEVKPGDYVTVRYVGYEPVTFQPNDNWHDLSLSPSAEQLDTVVIRPKDDKQAPWLAIGIAAGVSLLLLALKQKWI